MSPQTTTTTFVKLTNIKLFLGKKSYDYSVSVFCSDSSHDAEAQPTMEIKGKNNQLISFSSLSSRSFFVKAKTEASVIRLADSQLSFTTNASSPRLTTLTLHFSLYNTKSASGEIKPYHKSQEISSTSTSSYSLLFGEIGHIEFTTIVKTKEELDDEYKPLFARIVRDEAKPEHRQNISDEQLKERREKLLIQFEQATRANVVEKMETIQREELIRKIPNDGANDDAYEDDDNADADGEEQPLRDQETHQRLESSSPPRHHQLPSKPKIKISRQSTVMDIQEFCKENNIDDDVSKFLLDERVNGEIFFTPQFVSKSLLMKNSSFTRTKLQHLVIVRNESLLEQKTQRQQNEHKVPSFFSKQSKLGGNVHSRASFHNLDDEGEEEDSKNFFRLTREENNDTSPSTTMLLQKHNIEDIVNSTILPPSFDKNKIVEQILHHRFCFGESPKKSNAMLSHYAKFLCREVVNYPKNSNKNKNAKIAKYSPAYFFLTTLVETFGKVESQIDYTELLKVETKTLSSLSSSLSNNNNNGKKKVDPKILALTAEKHKKFLFRKIVEEISSFAFEIRIENNQNHQKIFEIPLDEEIPFWIVIMKEMGVIILSDHNESCHRFTFSSWRISINFFAALHVALNPVERLLDLPFEQHLVNNKIVEDISPVWLFLCQIVNLIEEESQQQQQNDLFFNLFKQRVVSEIDSQQHQRQDISLSLFCGHVTGRASTLYKSLPESERHSKTRKQILRASHRKCGIPLLVQIANALPPFVVMDDLLEKHGGILVHNTPHQFAWMTEWCGYFGAVDVLKWFDQKEPRFRGDVFLTPALSSLHRHEENGNKNCKYALCRALQRQSIVGRGRECVDFLKKFLVSSSTSEAERKFDDDDDEHHQIVSSVGIFDAIDADSSVGLQQILRMSSAKIINNNNNLEPTSSPIIYHLDEHLLWRLVNASLEHFLTNPNLFAYLCVSQEFSDAQLAQIDLLHKPENITPESLPVALAIQVCLNNNNSSTVEVWDFEKERFEMINVRRELERKKKLSMLSLITESTNNDDDEHIFHWTSERLQVFASTVIPNLGVENLKQLKCCRKALKAKALDLSSSSNNNQKSSSASRMDNESLKNLIVFTHVEDLDLSYNKELTIFHIGAEIIGEPVIMPSVKRLNLTGCNLGDSSFSSLLQELPNLEELVLNHNEHITGTFLSTFSTTATNSSSSAVMKKLDLSDCTLMGDALSLYLVNRFPNLEELNVKGNPFLSEIVIVDVAEKLLRLKRLGVDKLSNKAREKLVSKNSELQFI